MNCLSSDLDIITDMFDTVYDDTINKDELKDYYTGKAENIDCSCALWRNPFVWVVADLNLQKGPTADHRLCYSSSQSQSRYDSKSLQVEKDDACATCNT